MFRTFNDMTDMFEESLNKEENTLKITRTEKGRQPIKGDQEKGEDNTDNIVAHKLKYLKHTAIQILKQIG